MSDSEGQPAGLASNCAFVHAFCNVVNRDGNCFGRSTLTNPMFACVPLPLLLYAGYSWLRIGDPFAYSHAQALPMFSRLHVAPPWEGLISDIGVTLHSRVP